MKLFSEREGFKPSRLEFQEDQVDEALRLKLWNFIYLFLFIPVLTPTLSIHSKEGFIISRIWGFILEKPVDEIPARKVKVQDALKKFFFECEWFKIYDIVETISVGLPDGSERKEDFINTCNSIFKQELSAWRFVDSQLVKISSEEETQSVEEALGYSENLKSVKMHLKQSLHLLSDRQSPDYRNSIKESISAVESLCKIVVRDDSASLGKALDTIEKEGKLTFHPALKKSFDILYGYTSNADGIRHGQGLLQESNLDFEDAKYMLVSCSAFINFLVLKASKAGIDLTKE